MRYFHDLNKEKFKLRNINCPLPRYHALTDDVRDDTQPSVLSQMFMVTNFIWQITLFSQDNDIYWLEEKKSIKSSSLCV